MKRSTAAGLAGATGLAAGLLVAPATVQAAINYFDVTRVVHGTGTATCPANWKATGGGAIAPADTFSSLTSHEYVLKSSVPYGTTGWKATGTRTNGTFSSSSGWRFSTTSFQPTVYVVCVN